MSIEFMGQRWTILRTRDPVGGDRKNRAILGESDEADNLIIFDGTLPATRQAEVLLHELLHVTDMTVPEFAISSLSRAFYGLATDNELLRDNWLLHIVDGVASEAQAARINEKSQDIVEAQEEFGIFFRSVDEGPWVGDGIRQNELTHAYQLYVNREGGGLNRTAVLRAQHRLLSGIEGISATNHRSLARQLVEFFPTISEFPEKALTRIAQR